MKKLVVRFSAKSMKRLLDFDTDEERDAYSMAMEDFNEFMAQMNELQEENVMLEKLTGKKEMSMDEKVERIWEHRMMNIEDMDVDAFSRFINRHIFGDDKK